MKRFISLLAVVLFMVNALLASQALGHPSTDKLARLSLAKGKAIPDQYIVVLKDGADANAVAAVADVKPSHVYKAALNGFSAQLNAGQLNAVRRNPNVDYVEQDQEVTVDVTQPMDVNGDPWGLDRIDQRFLPLSSSFTYYLTGSGVTAYIIDTGILPTHPDFGARGADAYDAVDGVLPATDCHGHGTHVAGTIGGTTYGVAKGVNLRGVRVLGCNGSGTWTDVIEGIDWVRLNAVKPAVANLSLGGGYMASVNTAVTNLVNSGVFTSVAAGNSLMDACNYSPASTPNAYTVAASDKNDNYASAFSNYGPCVDGYAPGVDIKSAWLNNSTLTIDGTSMAAPHVAGCAAQYLQHNGNVPPAAITSWINNNATNGVIIGNPAGTPNRLLYCFKPDVWVKDKSVDTGREPDPATAAMNMWESPDIWNRLAGDGVYAHQNPEFGQINYMYARLRNRGHIAGTGTLRFYVANASAGLAWPTNWTQIGAVNVTVNPGAIVDVNVKWNPPGKGHYCILVRWESAQEPMTYGETSDVNYNTRYNNNIAWRNMNIVDLKLNWKDFSDLIIRNPLRELKPQRLVFREPREQLQDPLIRHAHLTVDLGPELMKRWQEAGGRGGGFERVGETQFRVIDPAGAWFDGLMLEPGVAFPVQIGFEVFAPATTERPYIFEAVQLDPEQREPLGGVTYQVLLPTTTK